MGGIALKGSASYVKLMQAIDAGSGNVADQLTELALGLKKQFDLRAVVTTMLDEGLGEALANLNITSLEADELSNWGSDIINEVIDRQPGGVEALAEELLGSSLAQASVDAAKYQSIKSQLQHTEAEQVALLNQSVTQTMISVDSSLAQLQAEIETMGGLLDSNAPASSSSNTTSSTTNRNANSNSNINTGIGNTSNNQSNVNVRNSNVTVNNGVNTNSQQSTSNATNPTQQNNKVQPRSSQQTSIANNKLSFWQKLESGITQSSLSNQTFNEGKYAAYQGEDLSKLNLTNLTSQQQAQFVEGYRAGQAEMGTASAFGQMVVPEVGVEGLTAKVSQWVGKLGLWSKNIENALIPTADSAQNVMNGIRLRQQLIEEQYASVLNPDGTLTPDAIKEARIIIPADRLTNTIVKSELQSITGDSLEGWAKYYTYPQILHPELDQNFEIHFYYNNITNEVYYGMDYKMVFQNRIQIPIEVNIPEVNNVPEVNFQP